MYLGLINEIIWIHPRWSNQIPDNDYTFKIGRHKLTGLIKISCLENYFLRSLIMWSLCAIMFNYFLRSLCHCV